MNKILLPFFLNLLILVSVTSCSSQPDVPKAKYVFLFIGDGMGMTQIYATELYIAAQNGNRQTKNLNMSNLPVQSYMTTYSANSWVTCSSASGTAIASGFKTNNGVLGKDSSLTINYETVAEKAKKKGYKVGIISSVSINNATPASFYAHQKYRSMYYSIAMELPKSGFDYFGGGGFLEPKGHKNQFPDAYENAVKEGYHIVNSLESIEKLKNGDEKVFAVNPFLMSKAEFSWEIDQEKESVSLAKFTEKGIEVLNNPNGFFMMVEGGKIDWACHSNDGAACIQEVIAFDSAVAVAKSFYNQHPDETLIIVTADHETGGMILGDGIEPNLKLLQYQNISAQRFEHELKKFKQSNKMASFEQIMELIQKHFSLGNASIKLALNKQDSLLLKKAFDETYNSEIEIDPDKDYLENNNVKTIPDIAVYLIDKKSGLNWTSHNHSGTPVPIMVIGQGQQYFSASIDNTDVAKIIERVMGL